jgi:hypothetical protein
MVAHRLSKDQARRIAVHAQLLDTPRPPDIVDVVDRLTILQIDPTAAIAPSADLVLWSRLGSSYHPADLTKAIEKDRSLIETVAYIRSPRDLPAVIAEAHSSVGRKERALPPRHPRLAGKGRAPALPRHPGHERRAMAVIRLDQQPERYEDARDPHPPRVRRDL